MSKEVKYLGVCLDQKANWNKNLSYIRDKALTSFHVCRQLLGKTWGLNPNMTYLSYVTIVRSSIIYALSVWWPKNRKEYSSKILQRLALEEALRIVKTDRKRHLGGHS